MNKIKQIVFSILFSGLNFEIIAMKNTKGPKLSFIGLKKNIGDDYDPDFFHIESPKSPFCSIASYEKKIQEEPLNFKEEYKDINNFLIYIKKNNNNNNKLKEYRIYLYNLFNNKEFKDRLNNMNIILSPSISIDFKNKHFFEDIHNNIPGLEPYSEDRTQAASHESYTQFELINLLKDYKKFKLQ